MKNFITNLKLPSFSKKEQKMIIGGRVSAGVPRDSRVTSGVPRDSRVTSGVPRDQKN